MGKINVLKADGSTGELELPEGIEGLDLNGMKLHTYEQTNAVKMKAMEDAKKAMQKDIEERDSALSDLQKKLDEFSNSKNGKDTEVISLRQQLADTQSNLKLLSDQINSERQEKRELTYQQTLSEQLTGRTLVPQGDSVFRNAAKTAKVEMEDGVVQYKLADGTIGDLGQWTEEFFSQPLGKAIQISHERGGANTNGTPGMPAQKKVTSLADYNKWREKQNQ